MNVFAEDLPNLPEDHDSAPRQEELGSGEEEVDYRDLYAEGRDEELQ